MCTSCGKHRERAGERAYGCCCSGGAAFTSYRRGKICCGCCESLHPIFLAWVRRDSSLSFVEPLFSPTQTSGLRVFPRLARWERELQADSRSFSGTAGSFMAKTSSQCIYCSCHQRGAQIPNIYATYPCRAVACCSTLNSRVPKM